MISAWPLSVSAVSPAAAGCMRWRKGGRHWVTVVVKASFELVHGRPARVVTAPMVLREERHRMPSGCLAAPSEVVPYLPSTGVLLTGHAHAPAGRTSAAVRLAVIADSPLLDKTLHVFGDRPKGAQTPQPFQQMPLVWERALGGQGHPANPAGTSTPNLVDPRDAKTPAGFGPIARHWPVRARLAGGADPGALDAMEPELPENVDWRYFHAAPADQQVARLRGDEWIVLDGMHPSLPRVHSRLPGVTAKARTHRQGGAEPAKPLDLGADMLVIDADQLVCSVVWRGFFALERAEDAALLQIVAGIEIMGQPVVWAPQAAPNTGAVQAAPPPSSTPAPPQVAWAAPSAAPAVASLASHLPDVNQVPAKGPQAAPYAGPPVAGAVSMGPQAAPNPGPPVAGPPATPFAGLPKVQPVPAALLRTAAVDLRSLPSAQMPFGPAQAAPPQQAVPAKVPYQAQSDPNDNGTMEPTPSPLAERLRSFYVARGFLDAEVRMAEQGLPDDTIHHLAFTIRENRQVRVTKRVFPCLAGEFSPDEIGGEIGSFLEEDLPGAEPLSTVDPREIVKMFGPTAGSGGRGVPPDLNPLMTYAPETYDRAIKHLRDLFHSKGYLNAVVGPVTLVRAACSKRSPAGQCVPVAPAGKIEVRCLRDSLGLPLPEPPVPEAFTCRPDPSRDLDCSPEVTVRIPIALGPQTTLYDLAFDGNASLNDVILAKIANLPLGTPISSVELESARIRVLDAYRKRGFAYADVRANAEYSPDRTRARIRFYVTERDKVVVTGFVVKGAARTNESLILRRMALVRGKPFQQDWARRSEEQIATLGTFSSVSVALEDADVPQRQKRVVVTVLEQPSQYLEPRLGFSSGDGVRFAFEYGHRNIGGLAISLTLRIQLSYLFDFLILDQGVRDNYDKLSALDRLERRNTASIVFPEIGLGPLVSLSLDGIDLRDNQRDFAITKEAIVPTVTFRPLRQITTQLGFSAEINDVSIFNTTALADTFGLLRAPQGRTVALAQRLGFTSDLRDNPFNATRGFLFSTAVEHVNAFPIGSADNLATITSHFLRFTGKAAGYLHFLGPKGPTIALSVSAGYNLQLFGPKLQANPNNPTKLQIVQGSKTYPDRLFFLGGVESIRAFLADSVVPQDVADRIQQREINPKTHHPWAIDDVPLRGGDVAINPRLELRVPVRDPVQVGLFLDTGNLWVDPSKFDITKLRYALGAGLRLGTPIGPVALDYGINLLRRSYLDEDFGAFHFSIGLF